MEKFSITVDDGVVTIESQDGLGTLRYQPIDALVEVCSRLGLDVDRIDTYTDDDDLNPEAALDPNGFRAGDAVAETLKDAGDINKRLYDHVQRIHGVAPSDLPAHADVNDWHAFDHATAGFEHEVDDHFLYIEEETALD